MGERHKNWGIAPRTIERKICCGFKFWSLANMHAGVIYAAGGCWWNSKQKKYLVGGGWISEDVPLSQSSRNPNFAKSVVRVVFTSLETFPESFQLSDFNQMPVKNNNLRFYFFFHTRVFGEVKLGISWRRAKITMTSPLMTRKKNRIFHADIDQWFFIQEQKCSKF